MQAKRELRSRLAAAAAALGAFFGAPAAADPSISSTVAPRYEPSPEDWRKAVAEVTTYIRRDYLGAPPADAPPTEPGPDALRKLASRLDRQSAYIDAKAFERMREPRPIGLAVGLVVSPTHGVILTAVPPGSAGTRAGLRVGDRLLTVNGTAVAGSEAEVFDQLRPSSAGPLNLRVERGGKTLALTAVPDLREQPTIREAEVRGAVGYVALNSFDHGAAEELKAAVARLLAERPDLAGLVLDLRGSPGGILDEVSATAAAFLGPGPVFRQRTRDGEKLVRAKKRSRDALGGRPLVVLIDSRTASGAELLAGALQARGRARLLGTRTYGQSLVQTLFPLVWGLGGAFKLTTAELRLPSGAGFHRRGITPDIAVAASLADLDPDPRYHLRQEDLPEDPRLPLATAAAPAPATAPDTPPPGYAGDYQLDRALALLSPR